MTAHAVGQLLLALACVIALARLLGALARRLGQPAVIGEILAGILVGPSVFGTVLSDHLFPVDIRTALAGLANVGLVLFMFIVGYEMDLTAVRGRRRAAVSISMGSIVLPLGLGFVLALWLARRHPVGDVVPFALFLGAAMSVTAFPVLARILTDRGMLRTEVGGLALAAGAVDDVVAWTLLAGVVAIGGSGGDVPWQTLLAAPYVLVMILVVRPLLRRLTAARERAGRLTPTVLAVMLVGLLLSCWVTEAIGVHAIFGAFLFGAVMPRAGGEALRHETLERLEQVSVLLLLPVFFVLAGLRVDLSTLDGRGLVDLTLILAVAITGKFVGAYAGARLNRISPRRAGALATLMNTRGLTEIVILTVGVQLGILTDALFSMMVVMALVTTAMAGPLLALVYPRGLVERDVAALQRAAFGEPRAYRVLALVPPDGSAERLVRLAADVAARHHPAEVLLSRILPYPLARIEVGTGLSGDLLAMTTAMGDLAKLAELVRTRGSTASVSARFGADPAADASAQVEATEPDVTVVAAPPDGCSAVFVRASGNADGEAVVRLAADLAVAHDVALIVATTGRPSRRVASLVHELGDRAAFGPAAPPSALVVGTGTTTGAHVLVRAGRDGVTRARMMHTLTGHTTDQRPLRAGDPRRLGRYTLTGRLGEGGMGTVYLAHTPDGTPVAVKVIRVDLAHDDEFRRRFRSEVNRARQVPPFCTAEVLDADPDHETPYLVVEYVDGPSLSAVVKGKGPLSPSNLHGLAIGVATALTAIHGAGVVHRDLKPNNVLLAAGSPKVIDFGIAHSPQATTGHTRTDQMVGTVGYMAPERFEPTPGSSITAAADIFSWGAVIAYAGTGRNPFGSDAAPVLATRILTRPPDLTGLSGPLRALVERALAKDPDDRPTARGLLDELLAAGSSRSSDLADAFTRQPDLLVAAEEAAQATDRVDDAVAPADAATAPVAASAATVPADAVTAPVVAADAVTAPVVAADAVTAGSDSTTRIDRPVPATEPPAEPPAPPLAPTPARSPMPGSGGGWGRFAVVVVALAALVTSLTVAGVVSGVIPVPDRGSGDRPSGTGSTSPSASAEPSPTPSGQLAITDPLTAEGAWQTRDDSGEQSTCRFDDALVVTRRNAGSYRCPGVPDLFTDFGVTVEVKLLTPGSCAGIWFRFVSAGYALRVCAHAYSLVTHGVGDSTAVAPLRTFTFTPTVTPGSTIRVGILAQGPSLTFSRNGQQVGTWKDDRFALGRVVLGIFDSGQSNSSPPFSVSFVNIEIRTFTN